LLSPAGPSAETKGLERRPLDPALAPFIAEVEAEFGPAPYLQSAQQFRAQVERLSTRKLPPRPAGMAVADRIAPTAAGPVPIRVYRPRALAGDRAAPALLYIHGGGWTVGSLDTHDPICADLAEEAPCCVVSIGYSLAPERPFPAAYHEIAALGAWAETHTQDLGIDRARIAIGGDSCGGNLATAVALAARDEGLRRYCFQLLIYGVFDTNFDTPSMLRNAEAPFLGRELMIWFWRQYLGGATTTDDPRAVPLRATDLRGLPPAFVSTAEYDPLLDEGKAYAARLADAGVPVEYRRAPALMHGFMRVRRLSRYAEEEFAAVCRALAKAFA
jgi:acetyl esterase